MIQHLKKSVFIGLKSLHLDVQERYWLANSLVGGVILFSRNYESKSQLSALCREIKAVRSDLLISVDHEGGRVQRFRNGFSAIPAMRTLGEWYDQDPAMALEKTKALAKLFIHELKGVGIDFSYVPVCDIDYGKNSAIGDRAFHSSPSIVAALVKALHQGLQEAGSIGVAKHFPGHGYTAVDTHLALACDERSMEALMANDLLPFKMLIDEGVAAIMPAHIVYPALDDQYTAVTSQKWMTYLREVLGFTGVIISDDLDMKGADHLGDINEKLEACFSVGINIALLCNDFDAIEALLG